MKNKGFTKLEILIVLGVIGLLGVMSAIALNSARERARDAKRLSDVARTQIALELYFNDHNGYPEAADAIALGQTSTSCLSSSGFMPVCKSDEESVYLKKMPVTPSTGLKDLVLCGAVTNTYCYQASEIAYRISFELENANPEAGLQKGINCASESGGESGECLVIE